jgi:hypothetical protein
VNSASAGPRHSSSAARLGCEPLEAVEVDVVRLELKRVAGRTRVQHSRGQDLPQLRDVDLHHLLSAVRHVLAPELVDDAVDRERAVGVDEQEGQERPLLSAPQPDFALRLAHLQRSEDPKVHLPASRVTVTRRFTG